MIDQPETIIFRNKTVQIIDEWISPEERDPAKFYYEIRDAEDFTRPIIVEPSVETRYLWGTLICDEELVFDSNNPCIVLTEEESELFIG